MFFPSQKNIFRVRLLLVLGTVLILAIVFIDIYISESGQNGGMGRRGYKASLAAHREQLLKSDELLHSRLWQLQSMDQQFSTLLTTGNDPGALVAANVSIQKAELEFQKSIDSITRTGKQYDEAARTNDFQNVTEFFKTILENRRFLAYMRLSSTSADKGSAGYITVLKLQEELQRKDKLLAANEGNRIHEKEKADLLNAIAAKDKQIENLQIDIQKGQAEKQSSTMALQQLQTELAEKNKLVAAAAKNSPADKKSSLALQNDVIAKTQQIRNLEAKIHSVETEQRAYSQALQNSLAGMQNALAEKNDQIRKLQTAIQKEQTEKKTYSQTVQNLQLELAQKNKLIVAANNRKAPADQKSAPNMQREIGDRDNRIRNLQTQLQQLQNAIQKEQIEKKTYSQTVQNLQLELAQKNKLIVAANNRKTPADQNATLNLQQAVAERDTRIRTLQSQLQQLQARTQTSMPVSNESLKNLQKTNTNLKVAYSNTLAELGLLTRKYNALKSENDQLRSNLR